MSSSDRRVPHILLVEDNAGDVLLIQDALESCKVQCIMHVVSNGAEALEKLQRIPPYSEFAVPDLIIMDMNVPRVSGHEVLARIKQDSRLASIPVLMITSSNAERDVLMSYHLHANAHIFKPESHAEFCELIRGVARLWLN